MCCEWFPAHFILKRMPSFLSAHLAFLWTVWSSSRTPPLNRTTTRLSTDMKTASPNWPTPSTTTTASPRPRRSCSIQRRVSWMTSWASSTSQRSRSSNNSWSRLVLQSENTTAAIFRFWSHFPAITDSFRQFLCLFKPSSLQRGEIQQKAGLKRINLTDWLILISSFKSDWSHLIDTMLPQPLKGLNPPPKNLIQRDVHTRWTLMGCEAAGGGTSGLPSVCSSHLDPVTLNMVPWQPGSTGNLWIVIVLRFMGLFSFPFININTIAGLLCALGGPGDNSAGHSTDCCPSTKLANIDRRGRLKIPFKGHL